MRCLLPSTDITKLGSPEICSLLRKTDSLWLFLRSWRQISTRLEGTAGHWSRQSVRTILDNYRTLRLVHLWRIWSMYGEWVYCPVEISISGKSYINPFKGFMEVVLGHVDIWPQQKEPVSQYFTELYLWRLKGLSLSFLSSITAEPELRVADTHYLIARESCKGKNK